MGNPEIVQDGEIIDLRQGIREGALDSMEILGEFLEQFGRPSEPSQEAQDAAFDFGANIGQCMLFGITIEDYEVMLEPGPRTVTAVARLAREEARGMTSELGKLCQIIRDSDDLVVGMSIESWRVSLEYILNSRLLLWGIEAYIEEALIETYSEDPDLEDLVGREHIKPYFQDLMDRINELDDEIFGNRFLIASILESQLKTEFDKWRALLSKTSSAPDVMPWILSGGLENVLIRIRKMRRVTEEEVPH